MPFQKVLEREIPTFLNLLTVTVGTGLDLRQSIACLRQSSEISCPHLVERFSSAVDSARVENTDFGSALLAASARKENAAIANLMYSLAQSPEDLSGLLSQLKFLNDFAQTNEEANCHKLGRNHLRRWSPHLCFFIIFAFPILLTLLFGPVVMPQPRWEYGPVVQPRYY